MENFADIARSVGSVDAAMREQALRRKEAAEAQIALPHLLSGLAMFVAIKNAVDRVESRAPQDHDIWIQFGDFNVREAAFIEPHTFIFEGFSRDGQDSAMVCHFSQVVVRVIYLPKQGEARTVSKVIQRFTR